MCKWKKCVNYTRSMPRVLFVIKAANFEITQGYITL